MGAGLASSAALGVALVETLIALGGGEATLLERARLAQVLEHRFLGVPCGLMDQLAAAGGRDGAALFIDCRAPSVRSVPMPSEVRIAVLDAMKPRRLAESAFARRRAECEEAARILGVPALRDASMDLVAGIRARLGETLFRRARHVVTENERVMAAVAALERHARERDACEQQALEGALEQRPLEQRPGEQRPLARRALEEIGSLLDASHASLRDDYAVSVPELDTITEIARAHPACYGSRLMGAGFGGSAIALIRAEAVEAFTAHVVEAYATATNLRPDVYICRPSAGSSVEWLDA
jgi:galactokinase